MRKPIVLCADSTCDIGPELCEKYHVHYYPYHILLDGKSYQDWVDLHPDQIYEVYREKHVLPKTAAINVGEFVEFFKPFVESGAEVIHLNLGSGLSSSYQNCCVAAKELPGIYPFDTCSLSSGSGLLVLKAAQMIEETELSAAEIVEELRKMIPKVHASFIIDTLEFLYKGGRCSALAMLGANLLKLKPCIEVSPQDGSMGVGKKYRGLLDKALVEYVRDQLDGRTNLDLSTIFITHGGISRERIELVRNEIKKYQNFAAIYDTRAGCTISSHCGPNTLGILFMTK